MSEELRYRPSIARFSADFAYKPPRPIVRGNGEEPDALRILAVSKLDESTSSAEQLHAAAVGRLFAGSYDSAARGLTNALRQLGTSGSERERAEILNDFAVLYFERGRRGERRDFILALDAVEQSWRLRRTPSAAWNRAVLFEIVGLKPAAVRAWRDYLADDSSSPWATEARTRLAALANETPRFSAEMKTQLRDACSDNDRVTVARIAAAFPKEARMLGEDELLPAWADAELAGHAREASVDLQCASLIGESLRQRSGEALLADTTATIRGGDASAAAEAILTYRAGRDAYMHRQFSAAERLLQEAEERLRRAGLPLAALADIYHAGSLHWANRYADVIVSLDDIDDPCGEPRRYQAACGLRKWITGLAKVQTGQPGDSIADYDKAIESFRAIGENENTASVLGLRAETLDYMTAFDDGWTDRLEALSMFPESLSARPTMWKSVAAAAVRDHYERAADAILSEIVTDARQRHDTLYVAEALMWKARARSRIDEAFTPDVAELQGALASIPDDAIRARTQANLRMVLTEIAGNASGVAAEDLNRALSFYRASSDRFNTMLAFARRSDAGQRTTDVDLMEAVREFERQAGDVADPFLRVLFSDRERQLFRNACEAQAVRGNYASALWFSDAARLAAFPIPVHRQSVQPKHPATFEERGRDLVDAIPPGVAVVQQELFENRLMTWVVRDHTLSFIARPVSTSEVMDDMDRLLIAMKGNEADAMRRAGGRLYDVLLREAEKNAGPDLLVYSPPDSLRALPIGLLYDGQRFFAEKRPFATTRTIGMPAWTRPAPVISSALLVAADEDYSSERLRGIVLEMAALQGIYGSRAERMTGSEVTPSSFLRRAAAYDVVHIGAHGRVDRRPLHNAMEFGAERLRACDVLSAHFEQAPVIVLAACRTSDDTEGRSSISLTTAFVAAGASAVIGTLWDVEDGGTAELLTEFHRSLSRGAKPWDALQTAQLEAIRKGKTADLWAAFQLQI